MELSSCSCRAMGQAAVDEDMLKVADEVVAKYRDKPGPLIQVLHEIQVRLGYLPREVLVRVAEGLGVPLSDVSGAVTFYGLFSLKPKGRHTISVCMGTACYVRGSDRIIERLEKDLKVKVGDTTQDGKFSLQVVRCVGACGLAPVVTVDNDVYARVKPEGIPAILNRYDGEAERTQDGRARAVHS